MPTEQVKPKTVAPVAKAPPSVKPPQVQEKIKEEKVVEKPKSVAQLQQEARKNYRRIMKAEAEKKK